MPTDRQERRRKAGFRSFVSWREEQRNAMPTDQTDEKLFYMRNDVDGTPGYLFQWVQGDAEFDGTRQGFWNGFAIELFELETLEALRPDLTLPPGGGPVEVEADIGCRCSECGEPFDPLTAGLCVCQKCNERSEPCVEHTPQEILEIDEDGNVTRVEPNGKVKPMPDVPSEEAIQISWDLAHSDKAKAWTPEQSFAMGELMGFAVACRSASEPSKPSPRTTSNGPAS